ncbi:MAG TPA: hypothetical protein DCE41_08100 [Cytophagales bacterium]|nr:hypothetical protein [Cytophagales bacterium]
MACGTESIFDPNTAVKVESIETMGDNGFLQSFVFGPGGQLQRIESSRPYDEEYQLEYVEGQLTGMRIYWPQTQLLYSSVAITYNLSGAVREVEVQYFDENGEVTATTHYAYEYDSRNRIREIWGTRSSASNYSFGRRFHWSQGNISQVDFLDEDRELMHEFFYKYDGRNNYQRGLPTSIYNPLLWGDHNIVEMSAEDYTGLLDLACNPCKTKYRYNLAGYPVSVTQEWGEDQTITYLEE